MTIQRPISPIARRAALCAVMAIFTVVSASCKSRNNKPRSQLDTNAANLIVASSVVFQRNTDRVSGTLKFKTKVPILCEIQYWTKDESTPPDEGAPLSKPCSQKQAQTDVEEILTELQINGTYVFKVLLWMPQLGKGAMKYFTIQEDGGDDNRVTDEMLVAKTLLPQNTTEILHYKFPSATNVLNIKKSVELPLGCQEKPPASLETYSQAQDSKFLESLSLRGFASATAAPHPAHPSRMMAFYEFLERDQIWEWDFKWKNSPFYFATKAPPYLDSISMTSGSAEPVRMRNKGLATQVTTHAVARETMKWEWVGKNTSNLTYLNVIIAEKSGEPKLFCSFDGRTGKAEIGKEWIDKLPAGEFEMTAVMDSTQIYSQQNPNFPIWLLKTHDWRFAHISLQ